MHLRMSSSVVKRTGMHRNRLRSHRLPGPVCEHVYAGTCRNEVAACGDLRTTSLYPGSDRILHVMFETVVTSCDGDDRCNARGSKYYSGRRSLASHIFSCRCSLLHPECCMPDCLHRRLVSPVPSTSGSGGLVALQIDIWILTILSGFKIDQ